MNSDNSDLMLYIPIGVNTRMDFMPGFGKNELLQSFIGIAIGSAIAIIVYIITNQVVALMLILIISIVGSVLAVTKNQMNISMVGYINNIMKFNQERQVFPYRQVRL